MVVSQPENNSKLSNRNEIIGVAIVLFLGIALRFYRLDYWSIWIEENHLMRDVRIYMENFSAIFSNPRPIFYLIVIPFFQTFGAELGIARAVSAGIGVISIPVLYILTRKALGQKVALLATFLFVIAPWHLFWSQNARFYTLLLVFYSLSYVFFYLTIETDRIFYNLLAIGFLGAATLTHSIGVMLWPIFIIHYLTIKYAPGEDPPGLQIKHLLPYFILPIVGYIILEILRVYVIGTNLLIVDLYVKFFNESTASFIGHPNPLSLFTTILYRIGFPLSILAIYGAFDLMFAVRTRLSFMLIYGAFLPIVFLVLISFVSISTTHRYVFMTLPFWIVLAASGVCRLIERRNYVIGILLIGLIALVTFLDPVIEDLIFYIAENRFLLILLILGAAGFVALLIYTNPTDHGVYPSYFLLFLLVFHPLIADLMYYAFQHGYRDNWVGPIAVIQVEDSTNSPVWIHPFPVGRFYLGERVESLDKIAEKPELSAGETVWIIEDHGAGLYYGDQYYEWIEVNECESYGDWSNYVAGRAWQMHLYRCQS